MRNTSGVYRLYLKSERENLSASIEINRHSYWHDHHLTKVVIRPYIHSVFPCVFKYCNTATANNAFIYWYNALHPNIAYIQWLLHFFGKGNGCKWAYIPFSGPSTRPGNIAYIIQLGWGMGCLKSHWTFYCRINVLCYSPGMCSMES